MDNQQSGRHAACRMHNARSCLHDMIAGHYILCSMLRKSTNVAVDGSGRKDALLTRIVLAYAVCSLHNHIGWHCAELDQTSCSLLTHPTSVDPAGGGIILLLRSAERRCSMGAEMPCSWPSPACTRDLYC